VRQFYEFLSPQQSLQHPVLVIRHPPIGEIVELKFRALAHPLARDGHQPRRQRLIKPQRQGGLVQQQPLWMTLAPSPAIVFARISPLKQSHILLLP
jgi:hypothetical protein